MKFHSIFSVFLTLLFCLEISHAETLPKDVRQNIDMVDQIEKQGRTGIEDLLLIYFPPRNFNLEFYKSFYGENKGVELRNLAAEASKDYHPTIDSPRMNYSLFGTYFDPLHDPENAAAFARVILASGAIKHFLTEEACMDRLGDARGKVMWPLLQKEANVIKASREAEAKLAAETKAAQTAAAKSKSRKSKK